MVGVGAARCLCRRAPWSGRQTETAPCLAQTGRQVKVLVTGREGQLARGLLEAADGAGVQVVAIGRPELDLADEKSVAAAVAREHPDVVVNAAAYTTVDKAEIEPAVARVVNALGAEYVAKACAAHSIPILHISTD